jgi:uncharacterized protein (DUF2147 family)
LHNNCTLHGILNLQYNMKHLLITVFTLLSSLGIMAQGNADDIVGIWKNGEGTGMVQIYKTKSGHYAGKIVWLKEPIDPDTGNPKLDKRNPDADKQNLPTLGLINLKGFSFNADEKIWENGTIYDPKNGQEYKCKITMDNKNTINVRGFIGISIIGRTDVWTRQVKK